MWMNGKLIARELNMRLIVALIIVLIALVVNAVQAQPKYKQFEIQDGNLVFVSVVDMEGDSATLAKQIHQLISSKAAIENVRLEGSIFFDIKEFVIDVKRYGRSYMTTPILYREGRWGANGRIDVKDGRYRILLTDITNVVNLGSIGYSNLGGDSYGYVNDVFLTKKRDNFKAGQTSNMDLVLAAFNDLFKHVEAKADW
jgi:hypothetical protein